MPVRYDWQEMLVVRIMELNSLMPHYYSELFLLANQLLEGEDNLKLHGMIKSVEMKCLSKEEIKGGLGIYDIEMSIESNQDYSSYMETDTGMKMYKLDVERELNKIKQYIFAKVKDIGKNRRFNKFI